MIDSCFDRAGQQFGSAIPWLDVYKLRVHEVAGQESFEHTLEKGSSVQTLQWISYKCSNAKTPRKKRKTEGENDQGLRILAVGTNKGAILLYSSAENKVVGVLSGSHTAPVTSISQLSSQPSRLWSCDFNGTIVEWDLVTLSAVRQFKSPEPDTHVVCPVTEVTVLVASTNIYLINVEDPSVSIQSFAGFAHPVSRILLSNQHSAFIAYSRDRTVNVTSISENRTINLLFAHSNIEAVSLAEDDSYLAVVTENGIAELFSSPFVAGGANLKVSTPGKGQRSRFITQSRKADGEIKLVRPGKVKSVLKVENVFFNRNNVVISWLESGSIPVFDSILFKTDAGDLVNPKIELEKPHQLLNVNNKSTVDPAAVVGYNESTTVISSGKDLHSLDDDESDQEETLAERLNALEVEISQDDEGDQSMKLNGVVPKTNLKELSTPGSFATLLSQALKTNDHALLETCLSSREDSLIKISIQRLESSLAVKLLERLAEKMARTPVRAGELNIWIKWVMITHGAYLVTVPNLLKTLSSLHSILSERVSTLPKLLALQGRLQLLSSQIEIRREVIVSADLDQASEDEEDVEYIEDGIVIANGEEDLDEDEGGDEEEDIGYINIEAADSEEELEGEDLARFSDLEAVDSMSEDSEDEIPVKSKSKKMNGRY